MKFLTLIIINYILLTSTSLPQYKYNFCQAENETLNFLTAPAKWETSDWLKLGGLIGGTAILMHFDSDIKANVLKDQRYYKSVPAEGGRIWGEVYTTGIIGGMFYLYGVVNDNNSNKKLGYEILQSAGYAGAVTLALKFIVGRNRPYKSNSPQKYDPLAFKSYTESLPSGHTTLAFSLSTVLAENTNSTVLKIIYYLPAVLTLASRVYQNKHWASDSLLGAGIGYFTAKYVTNSHTYVNVSINSAQQISISYSF